MRKLTVPGADSPHQMVRTEVDPFDVKRSAKTEHDANFRHERFEFSP
jgi:hypothetical protein